LNDVTSVRLHGIKACVFDAYGTLFDVSSASRAAEDALGSRWQPLADLWRTKQLQYTWLRGLGGHHADFWQVTSDALSFALESLRIDDADLHRRLMSLYLSLDVFPEVKPTLKRLKAGGLKLAILSNGTPAMLASAVEHAGIGPLLDAVLSVEDVGVFKPHPSVYRLASDRLKLAPEAVCFLSSNGWDAYAAKAFGFRVIWCNRYGQVPERLPATPDAAMSSMSALPDAVLP
jgi:2-haloacid dehalogenase